MNFDDFSVFHPRVYIKIYADCLIGTKLVHDLRHFVCKYDSKCHFHNAGVTLVSVKRPQTAKQILYVEMIGIPSRMSTAMSPGAGWGPTMTIMDPL